MMSSSEVSRASTPLPGERRNAGRTRWWIVWTLFGSTSINYISRQTFSVLSPMIATQYHLSHGDLAKIIGAFNCLTRLHGWWEASFSMQWAPA